jgi:hypothetical protein
MEQYQETSRRSRTVLTEQQVKDILRFKSSNQPSGLSFMAIGTKLAKVYGVSEKTVRDVWKGRTWRRMTLCLSREQSVTPSISDKVGSAVCANALCMWCYKDRNAPCPCEFNQSCSSIDNQLFLWTEQSLNWSTAIQDPFRNDWVLNDAFRQPN